jgi:hypothetical protein
VHESIRKDGVNDDREEWQHLYENFETTALLSAVDAVDCLRDDLNDGEGCRPPELRTDLLKLHELAMAVVNNGAMNELEQVQDTLAKLVALYPERACPTLTWTTPTDSDGGW